jgi:phosphate:Na+ symporter
MLLLTLGGLALFLLGLRRIVTSLDQLAVAGTRRALESATRSPWRALATGTAMGAFSQSGTATAISALGFVAGGVMAVREGIAYSFGAQIGATLAIQLAAFRIAAYALPMIGVGFFLARWPRARTGGELLLGAGLLFLGLSLIVDSMAAMLESEAFVLVLTTLGASPLAMTTVGFVIGTFLTSSNATTALALGLVAAGGSNMPAAIAFVAGGNAGATVIAIVAARELGTGAIRVAVMHTVVKLVAAYVVAFVAQPFAVLVQSMGGDGARQVANAHTVFNILVALPGTLFAGLTARIAERVMPAPQEESGPRYLDPAVVDEPRWALGLARREVVRISDEVLVMTELTARELRRGHWDGGAIRARETRTDRLARAVIRYLADVRQRHGPEPTSEWLFTWVTELETVGHLIRRVEEREDRLRNAGVAFSRAGRRELADACDALLARMRNAFTAMAVGHKGLARQVVDGRPVYEQLIKELRLEHLARLEARLPATRMSHMQHLEILALLRQIDASVTRVAGLVLAEEATRAQADR